MIPAIAQEESKFGTDAARRLTDTLFTILLIGLAILCLGGILASPLLVRLFAYGFTRDPAQFNLTVNLAMWLFPFVAMVSLVSYCEGILNHRNHFFIPKIAPGVVSVGIVIFVVLFSSRFTTPIYSLAAGTLIGGMAHLLMHIPILKKLWYFPRLNFSFNTPRVRFFMGEMGKVILIGIFAQINIVVLRTLASFLTAGSVTHFWNASHIVDLMNGIIAVGMSSALMPAAARSAAEKDWQNLRSQLDYSLNMSAFFLFPICTFMIFYHIPMVSILFRHGNFTYRDTLVTAAALQLLIPFILSVGGINIIKKVYFAIDDRNTLMAVGGSGVVLTGLIGMALIKPMGIRGLAVALSISTVLQLILYFYILRRKIRQIVHPAALFVPFLKIAAACLPAAIFLYLSAGKGKWQMGPRAPGNLLLVCCAALVTLITFLVAAYFLKIPELQSFIKRFKKKRWIR